jgi:hypothetical protein
MEEWRYSSTIIDLGTRWCEWSSSQLGRLTVGEIASGTHWVRGRVGLEAMEKREISCPCGESIAG